MPTGPGVRVDTCGYAGYRPSARFDSLLAKVIVHGDGDVASVVAKAARALAEFRVCGIETNLSVLRRLVARPEVSAYSVGTRFVDEHLPTLLADDGARRGPSRRRSGPRRGRPWTDTIRSPCSPTARRHR